jgi:hypothetical protein
MRQNRSAYRQAGEWFALSRVVQQVMLRALILNELQMAAEDGTGTELESAKLLKSVLN